jgi:hypothetical protein
MRRNAVLAAAAAVTCGAGVVAVAAPAEAAGWRNVSSKALAYNGSLDRVDFASKNVGWAVGSQGTMFSPKAAIVRWNGKGWVRQNSPVAFAPTDVAAAGPKKAWIVGYNLGGTVGLYWNGAKWSKVAYPLVGFPTQVAASADGTAYSVAGMDSSAGGPSTVLRWNGKAWVKVNIPLPPSSSISAVDVRSKNDVWLAGTTSPMGTTVNGMVLHWNGKSWKRLNIPGSMGVPAYQGVLHKIVAVGPKNVYVVRVRQNAQITNALLRWNGSSWKTINTPLNAAGIGLSSDGKSGVVMLPITNGNRSQYMHYNGSSWRTYNGPARQNGGVQIGDLDKRPGTPGIVSVGTSSSAKKKIPFIEYFG